MQAIDPFDGALLIDKPVGPTSHDIVEAVRRDFRIAKVGHCGTLDPNATGLLVLLLGRATKLSEKLMSADKVYEGTMKLGETTDSYDAQGELVASLPVPPTTVEELQTATSKAVTLPGPNGEASHSLRLVVTLTTFVPPFNTRFVPAVPSSPRARPQTGCPPIFALL